MTLMRELAQTLTHDFAGAVAAAERAEALVLEAANAALREAEAARRAGLAKVHRNREAAAKLVADSLRDEAAIESRYREAIEGVHDELGSLAGARIAGGAAPLKVLAGGKD